MGGWAQSAHESPQASKQERDSTRGHFKSPWQKVLERDCQSPGCGLSLAALAQPELSSASQRYCCFQQECAHRGHLKGIQQALRRRRKPVFNKPCENCVFSLHKAGAVQPGWQETMVKMLSRSAVLTKVSKGTWDLVQQDRRPGAVGQARVTLDVHPLPVVEGRGSDRTYRAALPETLPPTAPAEASKGGTT